MKELVLAAICVGVFQAVSLGDFRDVPKEKKHVYLFVGNSAMSGRDPDRDTVIHPRAWKYVLSGESKYTWQLAGEPICKDGGNKGDKGGPGMPFLKSLIEKSEDEDLYFGIIQSSGSAWTVEDRFLPGRKEYDEIVDHALLVKDDVTIKGLVSMVGLVEVEKGEVYVSDYLETVRKMVIYFRRDLGIDSLPYIHSGYPMKAGGVYEASKNRPREILQQQEQIPEVIPNSVVIPGHGLTIYDDIYKSHYDRAGCIEWANRTVDTLFAREWEMSRVSVAGLSGMPRPAGRAALRHEIMCRIISSGPVEGGGRSTIYMLNGKNLTGSTTRAMGYRVPQMMIHESD